MSYIISLLIYIGIAISILQNWLVVAGVLIVVFSMRAGAVLLIPLAIAVDGYFGNFYLWPMLSLSAVWWHITVIYLRPKVAFLRQKETV